MTIPPDEPIDPTIYAACDLMEALGDDPDEIARAIMFMSRVVTHEFPDPHRFAVGMSAVARMAGEVAHGLHSRATCGDHSPCVKSAQVIARAGARDN
jgi:hypothetical protein